MKVDYCCDRELFRKYYDQSGSGFLNSVEVYRGQPQRGHGLGNFFRSLGRTVMPLISKGARAIGKQVLRTGAEVASDVLSGENVGESIKKRSKAAASDALDNYLNRKRKRPAQGAPKRKKRKNGFVI